MMSQSGSSRRKPGLQTCNNCREAHLKCDFTAQSCKRCQRTGKICQRGRSKIRFRHGSSANLNLSFDNHQVWVKTCGNFSNMEIIDETDSIAADYTSEFDDYESPDNTELISQTTRMPTDDQSILISSQDPAVSTLDTMDNSRAPEVSNHQPHEYSALEQRTDVSPFSSNHLNDRSCSVHDHSDFHQVFPQASHDMPVSEMNTSIMASPGHFFDLRPSLGGVLGYPNIESPEIDQTTKVPLPFDNQVRPAIFCGLSEYLQALLVRYFITELAPWFDVNDPKRHFARIVPQRARACPPLLQAILTASARHLTRIKGYQDADGRVVWRGAHVSSLNEATALHYHDQCIQELLRSSGDPAQIKNESLLAAAIILRFYEEIDAPLQDHEDKEVLLRVINIFVNVQVPAPPSSLHSLSLARGFEQGSLDDLPVPDAQRSPILSDQTPSERSPDLSNIDISQSESLKTAGFWIAFRQELYSAYTKQRPFQLSLALCNEFRILSAADDASWTNRLVVLCADALEYCYGGVDTNLSPSIDKRRWAELSESSKVLTQHLPRSFAPLYYRKARPEDGEIFPEIWHVDPTHVTGIAHLELAKLLLAVFDPARPRWGSGYLQSLKSVSQKLRQTVSRLCGIALSDRRSPTGFIEACMGISTCGEYITDPREQQAVLEVLEITETEFAWPTSKVSEDLRRAWDTD